MNPQLGFYYCFGCQESGDAITFIRKVDGLDFAEAVERLAVRAGITLRYDTAGATQDRRKRERLTEAVQEAVDYYHRLLLEDPSGGRARGYLRSRGFDGDAARRFLLGWSPDWLRRAGAPPLHEEVLARRHRRGRARVREPGAEGAGLLPRPAHVPDLRPRRQPGRLRRPHAQRRRAEVQEHRRLRAVPQEPAALRPELGEGRDRRARRGRDLRGLHRRHGVRARRACRTRSPPAAPRSPTTTCRS